MLPGLLPVLKGAKPAPSVVQRATAGSAARTTTIPVAFAAAVAGNLILIELCVETGITVTTPAGYTLLQAAVTNVNVRTYIFYKVAAGGETGVSITTGNSHYAYLMREIAGFTGTPEITAYGTGNDTAPNPASLTPAGGSKNYLWLAGAMYGIAGGTTSAYPAGYSNGTTASATGSALFRTAGAEKQAVGASEDPGAYTISASQTWIAYTIAISP